MILYLGKRIGSGVVTILAVLIFTFLLIRVTGDPIGLLVPVDAPPEDVERIRQLYELDQPWTVQLVKYLDQLAHFDLGTSIRYKAQVVDLFAKTIPNTLILVAAAMGWTLVLGIPLGVAMALAPNSRFDKAMTLFVGFMQSTPGFVLGLLMITFVALGLGWFPVAGFEQPKSIVLPAIAVASVSFAGVVRLTRDEAMVVLRSDYVRYARAKGLPRATIWRRHVLRNVLSPVAGLTYMTLARALGGSFVIESIFNWPGIGKLFFEAASSRDYTVVQGYVVYVGVAIVIINIASEFLNTWIDPRLRMAR